MEETLLGRRSSAYHSSKKLVLQRVIVNGVPDFVNAAMPTATSGKSPLHKAARNQRLHVVYFPFQLVIDSSFDL